MESHCSKRFFEESLRGQGTLILAVVFTQFSPSPKIKKVWCTQVKIKCVRQNEGKVSTWVFIVPRTRKLHFAINNLLIMKDLSISRPPGNIVLLLAIKTPHSTFSVQFGATHKQGSYVTTSLSEELNKQKLQVTFIKSGPMPHRIVMIVLALQKEFLASLRST